MKTGEWIIVVILIAVLVMALVGQKQGICSRALDRSHTAADTATVYRLNVCPRGAS